MDCSAGKTRLALHVPSSYELESVAIIIVIIIITVFLIVQLADQQTVCAGIPACERPILLLLLSDGGMLAYQAFQPPHHPLAFRRLPLDWTPHQTPVTARSAPLPHPNAVQPTQRMQVCRPIS